MVEAACQKPKVTGFEAAASGDDSTPEEAAEEEEKRMQRVGSTLSSATTRLAPRLRLTSLLLLTSTSRDETPRPHCAGAQIQAPHRSYTRERKTHTEKKIIWEKNLKGEKTLGIIGREKKTLISGFA